MTASVTRRYPIKTERLSTTPRALIRRVSGACRVRTHRAALDFFWSIAPIFFRGWTRSRRTCGRTWVAAYSPFGALPVQRDDLKFLVSTAPAPRAKAPSEAEQVEKKKAAPAAAAPAPTAEEEKPEEAATAEDAMAKQIRDDGTMDTGDDGLFEEEE